MDTTLARTFLEIVATGSFIRAAQRLNVSQTAVSARVRTLEEQLGRPLFLRNKAGAVLTAAGEQFLRYAPTFIQVWERARQQVAVPPGHNSVLVIGGEFSLWQPLLIDWTLWMRRSLPEVALRVHVDIARDLLPLIANGIVDIGVLYAPEHRPGLSVDLLVEEKLVLVTTDPAAPLRGYVEVDWGEEFAARRRESFASTPGSGLSVGLGPLALAYILAAGGAGYFRMRVVEPYLATGALHLVDGAPQFSYPIYAVYPAASANPDLSAALAGLHAVAGATPPSPRPPA